MNNEGLYKKKCDRLARHNLLLEKLLKECLERVLADSLVLDEYNNLIQPGTSKNEIYLQNAKVFIETINVKKG